MCKGVSFQLKPISLTENESIFFNVIEKNIKII